MSERVGMWDATRGRAARAAAGSVSAGAALQLTVAVSGIVSARLLGVEDRGRLALLWVVTIVAAQIATLGLHVAISYAVAHGETARAVLDRLRGRIVLQLAAAPLITAVGMLAALDHSRSTLVAGACMLVGASAFIVLLYAIAVAQGEQRYRAVQLHRLVQPLLFTAVLVALALAGVGELVTVSATWAATMALAALFAWRHTAHAWLAGEARRSADGAPRSADGAPRSAGGAPHSARELQRFGARSFFGAFGTTEHMMLDQLLAGVLLTPVGFGLYVAANAFSNLPRFLGQSLGLVAYPEVVAARGERMPALRRYTLLSAAITAPVVLVLLLAIEWLLPLLFGKAFSDAVPVARILLVAAFLQSLRRVLTEASRGLGTGVPGTAGEIAFAVVLIAAAIPLAGEFGEQGAAAAVLAAAAAGWLALVAALWLARRAGTVATDARPGIEQAAPEPALEPPEARL